MVSFPVRAVCAHEIAAGGGCASGAYPAVAMAAAAVLLERYAPTGWNVCHTR